MEIFGKLQVIFKRKRLRNGVPFILLVAGGSLFLKEFQDLKFKYNTQNVRIFKNEMEKSGVDYTPNKMTIDSVYEEMKEKNLDDWENKRIPRPWEE